MKQNSDLSGISGAQERTRTSTPLPVLAPEASASTIPPPGHRGVVRERLLLWGGGVNWILATK